MTVLAGKYGPEGMKYANGQLASGVVATVLTTGLTLAAVYMDKTKISLGPNPLTTDILGNLSFYAIPGEYIVQIAGYNLNVMVDLHPEEPLPYASSNVSYRHNQLVAATVWPVPHGLGRYPAAVDIYSSDLSVRYEDYNVRHVDTNNLIISTDISIAGVAFMT